MSQGFKRRSIRLPGYDYSNAGAYFVTVCVQGQKCLLGEIIHEEMRLNDPGKMVKSVWDEIPQHYSSVDVDAFTVMPNHIHGIIILGVGAGPRACPEDIKGQPRGVAPTLSLPDVVHRFKSYTTAQYHKGVFQIHWPPFQGRLWQRNYYEQVIRNEDELEKIREYIVYNPSKWATDRENPETAQSPRDHRDEMDIIWGG